MLELCHNNISVCAQKVRIVLAEKGLPWTNRHLSLAKGDQLTAEFKKMNPRGVVPVLVHDGNIIVESSVICTYLDEVFPNPPLTPTTFALRSRSQRRIPPACWPALGVVTASANSWPTLTLPRIVERESTIIETWPPIRSPIA